MRKTVNSSFKKDSICVSRDKLPELLGCGQSTADRIAREAGAGIKVGKRVLIKIDKIREYLNTLAE